MLKDMPDRMRRSDNVNLCQILYVKKIVGMPERMSKDLPETDAR